MPVSDWTKVARTASSLGALRYGVPTTFRTPVRHAYGDYVAGNVNIPGSKGGEKIERPRTPPGRTEVQDWEIGFRHLVVENAASAKRRAARLTDPGVK
jgi:hypothetical protein